jgi:hypothetical protein
VNDRFFARIQTATFVTEQIVTVDGRPKREKVKVGIPEASQAALHALAGRTYASAKEFSAAVATVLPAAEASREEFALIGSARSNNSYWIAVLLISLALAGHQAWSANLFTLASDVFPKKATASVIGIGGMSGAVVNIIATYSLGQVLMTSGPSGYFFAFFVAGSAYLVLLGAVHLMMPKLTPLDENLRPVTG